MPRNVHRLLSIPALLPFSKSSRPPALLAKRMKRVLLKFFWKGEQFARVPGSSRPVNQVTVLFELCNLPKPLCPLLVRDSHHVGKITRSQAAADRQLNPLEQPSGTPFLFEPIHRNRRSAVFGVSTATSLANREMSDNEPLRCQRMCRVSTHKFSSSPVRPWMVEKRFREQASWLKRPVGVGAQSSG